MDNYTEQILGAKPTTAGRMAFAGSVCLTAIGVFLMLFLNFGIGVAVAIVGGILIAYTKGMQSIEYEYLFINGDCDIACILNKSSRKGKLSFTEGDVLRILPYNSDKCQNELQVNSELSVKNYTSGISDNSHSWYVFFITGKNVTTAAIMEFNSKTLDHVKLNYKSKFEA